MNGNRSEKVQTVVKNSNVNKVIGRDENNFLGGSNFFASNLEKKILKLLHIEYSKNGNNRKKILHTHEALEIKDGFDMSTINDSKLVKTEGVFYRMTSDGIRYMDSLSPQELNMIVLPSEQKEKDILMARQRQIMQEKRANGYRNSAR